ncbi:alpha-1A adrenergic receptor-like [Anneissia japonica]|uniref:alpha-1A adrenergic receptor-like n=1 Tax=Anneissia japonica TaxID=1529436 RepID=UPI0014258739|nr:alpha-1A adrenergic receptor-like [Anneissia japonica]XP_033121648.1 alpha-1A adrenergic receptor-like [Anneissia japonica]XP_033121657.1 alpha-1A adrenergic receptor-like [Anneissia japonica]
MSNSNYIVPPWSNASSCQTAVSSVLITLSVTLSVFGVMVNLLVIAAFMSHKKIRNRMYNHFLIHLSISGFLFDITVLCILTSRITCSAIWNLQKYLVACCFTYGIFSDLELTVIAWDRYHALTSPFRYSQIVTFRRTICLIFALWLVSLSSAVLFMYKHNPKVLFLPFFVCIIEWLMIFITAFIHIRVFRIAQRHAIQIKQRIPRPTFCHSVGYSVNEDVTEKGLVFMRSKFSSRIKRLKSLAELRATYTTSMILIAFVIFWLPSLIRLTVNLIKPDIDHDFINNFQKVANILCVVGTIVNPCIYSLRNSDFKIAIAKLRKLCLRV